jgi:hypothetical protein
MPGSEQVALSSVRSGRALRRVMPAQSGPNLHVRPTVQVIDQVTDQVDLLTARDLQDMPTALGTLTEQVTVQVTAQVTMQVVPRISLSDHPIISFSDRP